MIDEREQTEWFERHERRIKRQERIGLAIRVVVSLASAAILLWSVGHH